MSISDLSKASLASVRSIGKAAAPVSAPADADGDHDGDVSSKSASLSPTQGKNVDFGA